MKKTFVLQAVLALLFYGKLNAQQNNFNDDYGQYVPEMKAVSRQIMQAPQGPSLLTKKGLEADRQMANLLDAARPKLTPVVKQIPGPGGKIGLRIFRPDTIRAVVLDIHGGGWTAGSAANDDLFNDEMARKCKVAVVSADYRLAPENPFIACFADCQAAAKWLVTNAMAEFGTENLFLSGGSAGAHLCALTTLYIRDSLHAVSKVKGVNLMYGLFDLGRTPSCRNVSDTDLLINRTVLNETFQLVFPGWAMQKKQSPLFSPLYAGLGNLPPAIFTVGTNDPLRDDTYFMEARWRMAGNKTFLAVYPEAWHAFNAFPVKMAGVANERIFKWISAAISSQ